MPTSRKSSVGPFVHVWLAISLLLNISGMASIVDGFVAWAGFFRDFVDVYRTSIREPLLSVAYLVWPASWPRIPGWVADWMYIGTGFILAWNIDCIRMHGKSLLLYLNDQLAAEEQMKHAPLSAKPGLIFMVLVLTILISPLVIIFKPLAMLLRIWTTAEITGDDERGRRIFLYWLMLVGTFLLLMFLNWQLKSDGVW